MIKERIELKVSTTAISGTAATSDATSDAIEFTSNSYWSLSAWTESLSVTGDNPTVSIEVSNSNDVDSFVAITNAENIDLSSPAFFESSYSQWRYFRVVYSSEGATAGTMYFDLIIGK